MNPKNNPFDAEEFVNSIGAIGELAGALMASLLQNGFTRDEAMSLVSTMMVELLSGGMSNRRRDE